MPTTSAWALSIAVMRRSLLPLPGTTEEGTQPAVEPAAETAPVATTLPPVGAGWTKPFLRKQEKNTVRPARCGIYREQREGNRLITPATIRLFGVGHIIELGDRERVAQAIRCFKPHRDLRVAHVRFAQGFFDGFRIARWRDRRGLCHGDA